MTLRTQYIIIITFMFVLSLSAIGIFFLTSIYKVYEQNTYDNLYTQSKQLSAALDSYFNNIDTLAVREFNDPAVIEIFTEKDEAKRKKKFEERFLEYKQLPSRQGYRTGILKNIVSTYIFLDETHYINLPYLSVSADEENLETIYRQSKLKKSSSPLFFPPTSTRHNIYFVRNVYNLPTESANISLVYCLSEGFLSTMLNQNPNIITYLIDENGIVFSAIDKSMLGKKINERLLIDGFPEGIHDINLGNDILLTKYERVAWDRLILITCISKNIAFSDMKNRLVYYILISLSISATFILLGNFVIHYLTSFMKDIVACMEQIGKGNYDVRLHHSSSRDLKLISETFNSMASRIRHLIDDVYKAKLAARESELRFLQSQMNPHFLFNILTTIRTKAKLAGNETVSNMLIALNELLRAGIYTNNDELTTLEIELDYVKKYLYLQKMRFQHMLEYKIFVHDSSVLGCRIPKLSIEAIVENSVVHGIEQKIGGGCVDVFVLCDNRKVYVIVNDDGVGFDMGTLNLSDKTMSAIPRGNHSQIGLKNTDRRLKLIFGEEYGLLIDSHENAGTCVIITIPIDGERREYNV
ncbi:MAG: sensor histidine kinase [Bacillota bacterium]